jgi:hypothetical protein
LNGLLAQRFLTDGAAQDIEHFLPVSGFAGCLSVAAASSTSSGGSFLRKRDEFHPKVFPFQPQLAAGTSVKFR